MPSLCKQMTCPAPLLILIVSTAGRNNERRIEFGSADLRINPDGLHLRPFRGVRPDSDRQSEPLRGLSRCCPR